MRLFFGFLLFLLWAAFARWYYVCEIKDGCAPQIEEVISRPNDLSLLLEDSVILANYEHFAFEQSSTAPELLPNNRTFLDQIAQFLKARPNIGLTITGYFRPSEKDMKSGYYENLGIARAETLRRALTARGVSEDRISLDYNQADTEALDRPIRFSAFRNASTDEYEGYERLKFTFFDMTYSDANFEYNSDAFKPGEQFIYYADSVITFLNLADSADLTIIGHTDNIGSDEFNIDLGLRRAKSAKNYFVDKGLAEDRIKTESEGKQSPVAPNDTPENRQKNRRVNFKINVDQESTD